MPQTIERASLLDDVSRLEAIMARPADTAYQLVSNLQAVYRTFADVDFARYDVAETKSFAPQALYRLFDFSMSLRDRIMGWHSRGVFNRQAQGAIRDVLRAARYAIDMLGELNTSYARLPPKAVMLRAFTGTNFNTLVNPSFDTGEHLPFLSGDLLLMRGLHHNSAAIARIGDLNSQFSHVGMVYIDDAGKHWAVEALIEVGATITPLEEVLSHQLARCAVFRHKDRALAERAARMIHDRVAKTLGFWKSPIVYDFTMKLDNYDQLFCSKLVRQAFDMASSGNVKLPAFTTRLDMRNRDFLDRIGVEAIETFAPGDIEIDPDLELVAEWRDYRATSTIRMQDIVMDKFFDWMDIHGYRFKDTFATRMIGVFGRASSLLSKEAKQAIKDLVPIIPRNMSRKTIATIAMLHKTAEPIAKDLYQIEADRIERTGQPIHPREVAIYLEERRKASGRTIGYLTAPT